MSPLLACDLSSLRVRGAFVGSKDHAVQARWSSRIGRGCWIAFRIRWCCRYTASVAPAHFALATPFW